MVLIPTLRRLNEKAVWLNGSIEAKDPTLCSAPFLPPHPRQQAVLA